MIKEYCDICGKEVKTDKYVLPESHIRTGVGEKNLICTVLKSAENDICKDCADEMGRMISGYKNCKKNGAECYMVCDNTFIMSKRK